MTIRDELEEIPRRGKLLLVHDVIAWAKAHPNSELHSEFEWDDKKAGQAYRVEQARRIIQLYLVTEEGTRTEVSLSIDRVKGGGYRRLDDVVRSKSLYKILLEDALRELDRVQESYSQVRDLQPVWVAKDQVRRKQSRAKRRVANHSEARLS